MRTFQHADRAGAGQAVWDEAVLLDIDRTGRLPRDADGRLPPVFISAFKARD